MHDFWIGTSASKIGLEGESRQDPVDGARRNFKNLKFPTTETIEDLITLELNDKDQASLMIAALTSDLETLFKKARLYSTTGLGSKILLHQEPTDGDVWESQVLDGWIEYTGQGDPSLDRLRGSMGVVLHVVRQNWWETTEAQLPTAGVLGADDYAGTTITNKFAFTNYSNTMELPLDSANQGVYLPCEIRMQIKNLTNTSLGVLCVAHNYSSAAVGKSYLLEDTTATGGSSNDDAASSGGKNKTCTWTDTAEATLLTWSLANTFCRDSAGNFFKGIVRLADDLAYTDLELKVKLFVASTTTLVGESAWGPAVAALRMQEIPILRLPPFVLNSPAAAAGLNLALVARRNTTGSHSIKVDYLQLMAIDGWRRYDPIYAIPQNWYLTDNGPLNIVSTLNTSSEELITHIATGNKFMLQPKVMNTFYFAWMNSTGGMVITDQLLVKVWAKKRMRF